MAIFRWGRRLSPKALVALGIDKKRKKSPCHATFVNAGVKFHRQAGAIIRQS
jgi:hypothetical protein